MAHFRRWSQQVAWHSVVASANGNKDSKFPDSFVNMSQLCCSSDCSPRSQMNNHMPTCKFHTHGCPFYPSIRSKPVMQAHLQLCQSGIHIRWHLHSWHRWHNLECWGRQLEGEFWGHSHGNWWSWRNCWSSRNCWWRRQDGRWGGGKAGGAGGVATLQGGARISRGLSLKGNQACDMLQLAIMDHPTCAKTWHGMV